ncbi:hypothetical protein V1L52_05245 [Treponema sp. HNW]|uniref:hypothetical protein n=1 Tax=Treponema sp. HNW TaxID=3116654 RepID=UPI003D0B648F
MILFILEGEKREPQIYKTMQYLFLDSDSKNEILVSYCNNIYSLYKKMKQHDIFNNSGSDIVHILKEELSENKINTVLKDIEYSDGFSEIYLFFDYDIHIPDKFNKISIEEQNNNVTEMLEYFNDETGNGKLYINYPMIESIRYFKKELPDNDYIHYTVNLDSKKSFKELANEESFYKNMDFISFKMNKKTLKIKVPDNPEKIQKLKNNWNHIKNLNVKKANYICFENDVLPKVKSEINQLAIFKSQVSAYVLPHQKIAILNAFPLFLYEYTR